MNRVTLNTLASKLNVSTTTISKALRGKPGIGKDMVNRVKSLAEELNYSPNIFAQSLKQAVSNSIGLMVTQDITNPYYSSLVSLIEEKISEKDKTLLLALGKKNYEKERHGLKQFTGGRVSGVIIGPVFRQRDLKAIWDFIDHNIPTVLFSCVDELPVSYVAIDLREGARIAIEYLIKKGHKNIGYLCCPPADMQETGQTRKEGFEKALFDNNLPLWGKNLIISENSTSVEAFNRMDELIQNNRREELPTAFFCHNDHVAIGAMAACAKHSLKVPEDISLIGFDDIPDSKMTNPGLTTMGGIIENLADELVDTLDTLIEKRPGQPIRKFIVPEIVERNSVAVPCS